MLKSLFASHLKMILRDKQTLGTALVAPVMIVTLFGFLAQREARATSLAIYRASSDQVSAQFVKALGAEKTPEGRHKFEVTETDSEASARALLEEREAEMALIIPDLSMQASVVLLYDERAPEGLPSVMASVRALAHDFNLKLAGAEERVRVLPRGIRTGGQVRGLEFLIPLALMISIVLGSLAGAAQRFTQYREQGVLKRLQVTPLSPRVFLLTDHGGRLVLTLLQTGVVLALAPLFDFNVGDAAAWLVLFALAGSLIFTSLGVVASNFAKSPEAASNIASAVGSLLLLASMPGLAFPKLAEVFAILPFELLQGAMRSVIQEGPSALEMPKLLALAGWIVGALVLALATFTFSRPAGGTPAR